ncbi:Ferredoxin related-protein [Snodgrassella alvi wkB2]|uniref:(2Fe-2S) ferredoxin domain-containing protein n=1 Tax=Snodgrassella alvi TaxID=1196083 RepID=A0ABD7Z2M2_9NEIS|nr:hypothetical protein [Snodgrassella alvi]AHN28971.1 Ferredoxin related-protein [Snodgrassella alvi wkB2]ORF32435.1 2Fe-2S ferredoxin [Snodgrassella alvi]PIT45611.1 2Fe-2S ferredoxin [Snodgrassella alvi]UOO97981.1 (2Fe-2S) ferredoxin domain-containing protein [Snodgrassella alvi wkB2]WLS98075.1 (2Fe-2S) ferredoxin domain-containing protein [Snodgrassella alvi]
MSYYAKHLFVCTNRRDNPCRQSCGDDDVGADAVDYLKGHAKDMGLMGVGKLRISSAGCLGRCDEGPVMVLYPQGRWYTYVDESDLQEILDEELANDRVVTRLLMDKHESNE